MAPKLPREALRALSDPTHLSSGGTYYKYWLSKAEKIKNEKFNKYSGLILDLKERHAAAVARFAAMIREILAPRPGVVVCAVPSHDPAKTESGLTDVIAELCDGGGCINGASVLRRHTLIPKLAHGGERSEQIHLDSIKVTVWYYGALSETFARSFPGPLSDELHQSVAAFSSR